MASPSKVELKDFDDPLIFNEFEKALNRYESRNFVLEFDGDHACGAFDLDENSIEELLRERNAASENRKKLPTRWINIWFPELQKDILKRLANHYGFSPRLLGTMQSDHKTPQHIPSPGRVHRQHLWNKNAKERREAVGEAVAQVFDVIAGDVESHAKLESASHQRSLPDINHYMIVNEVWHYASVDWGYKFTCIGFNSLYNTHKQIKSSSNKPAGKRIWCWLVLCDDDTVIAIHENPYPGGEPVAEELKLIRFNLNNVFKQLSKVTDPSGELNPIMTVHIRPGLQSAARSGMHIRDDDGPSLLFHYLFDDWLTTYGLVSRREHQYGDRLEKVRMDMAESQNSANLENINRLHHYGRQLAVLKRVYESYNMIIERILSGPQSTQSSLQKPIFRKQSITFAKFESQTQEEQEGLSESVIGYGVPVTTAAAVRFERLKDRINLYALSEIQECLDEKESLVMLIFNLLALKEASYVERLTRITILLAKATILFIPVSLMSTYFSINLNGVGGYSPSTYWTAFGVVFALSLVGLIGFGYISGSMEGAPVYKSVSRKVIDTSRGIARRLRKAATEKTL